MKHTNPQAPFKHKEIPLFSSLLLNMDREPKNIIYLKKFFNVKDISKKTKTMQRVEENKNYYL